MSAEVIDLRDLRAHRAGVAADQRTELERLLSEARAEGYREGAGDGFHRGMRAAMESMYVDPPAMLPGRNLAAVQIGGCAS